MSADLAAAWVAAGASLVVAAGAAITASISSRHVNTLQTDQLKLANELDVQKQLLTSALAEHQAERDARRDYEYEARKRLYHECEPLFFEAAGLVQRARHRIASLAQTARRGDIRADGSGWMDHQDYYFQSTVFFLLAPTAVAKILRKRLTSIDLGLEPRLNLQYQVLNLINMSFAEDFALAGRGEPPLRYDPDKTDAGLPGRDELLSKQPDIFRRQGLYLGTLETVAQSMVDDAGTGCKSFGEFVKDWNDPTTDVHALIPEFVSLFGGFHPQSRPVLWRVLVLQYLECSLFLSIQEGGITDRRQLASIVEMADLPGPAELDWRRQTDTIDPDVVTRTLAIAHEHLLARVGRLDPLPGQT